MDLKALLTETDPLALGALLGLLVTILVSIGVFTFVIAKLPKAQKR